MSALMSATEPLLDKPSDMADVSDIFWASFSKTKQNEVVAMKLLDLAARLVEAVNYYLAPTLAKLQAQEAARVAGMEIHKELELDRTSQEIMLNIPNSIRGIAAFAQMGGDLAADGLLVRQLLQHIQDSELSE
ncbi:hypothetical protein Cha6605_1353 [Chamaesiphon minutus PCC 6605]|uniref:Uncharacterized protein n=2 Tax=Chamaesiphon TaxID=217161 RepID=K9UEA9_CHAP6|nr:hypothetical protein Cha6605_1353 [Chamaesiphon minutus PCC 6605]